MLKINGLIINVKHYYLLFKNRELKRYYPMNLFTISLSIEILFAQIHFQ